MALQSRSPQANLLLVGAVCLYHPSQIKEWPFPHTSGYGNPSIISLEDQANAFQTNVYWIGVASIACACLQLFSWARGLTRKRK
jgi:hypothetical protein